MLKLNEQFIALEEKLSAVETRLEDDNNYSYTDQFETDYFEIKTEIEETEEYFEMELRGGTDASKMRRLKRRLRSIEDDTDINAFEDYKREFNERYYNDEEDF